MCLLMFKFLRVNYFLIVQAKENNFFLLLLNIYTCIYNLQCWPVRSRVADRESPQDGRKGEGQVIICNAWSWICEHSAVLKAHLKYVYRIFLSTYQSEWRTYLTYKHSLLQQRKLIKTWVTQHKYLIIFSTFNILVKCVIIDLFFCIQRCGNGAIMKAASFCISIYT